MRYHHPGTYENLQARLVQAEKERDQAQDALSRIRDAAGTTPLVSLPWLLRVLDGSNPASRLNDG